jgi:very-short-patch-repair endonuclease
MGVSRAIPRGFFYLDFAVPELRYAAEYDGEEFHGEDPAEADTARRTWLEDTGGWMFGIFVAADVRGTGQEASDRLSRDLAEARRTVGSRRRVRG